MTSIKLVILITKYKNHFELNKNIIYCNSIDECRNKLINFLADEFSNLNIDFPMDLNEFEYIWFDYSYVKSNAFDYLIVSSEETLIWNNPWELQDIYSDVLDIMYEKDVNNPPNFSELYGESINE
jgi:hypothetical protein